MILKIHQISLIAYLSLKEKTIGKLDDRAMEKLNIEGKIAKENHKM